MKFAIAGPMYTQARWLDLDDGQKVFFAKDPTNKYDPKAIRVLTELGEPIGYVPKTLTSLVAEKMANKAYIFSVCADAYSISIHVKVED